MATYNIKWLRNLFGTRFFPVTHITAVRDNNNVNLETLLNSEQKVVSTALNDLNERVLDLEDKVNNMQTIILNLLNR